MTEQVTFPRLLIQKIYKSQGKWSLGGIPLYVLNDLSHSAKESILLWLRKKSSYYIVNLRWMTGHDSLSSVVVDSSPTLDQRQFYGVFFSLFFFSFIVIPFVNFAFGVFVK